MKLLRTNTHYMYFYLYNNITQLERGAPQYCARIDWEKSRDGGGLYIAELSTRTRKARSFLVIICLLESLLYMFLYSLVLALLIISLLLFPFLITFGFVVHECLNS